MAFDTIYKWYDRAEAIMQGMETMSEAFGSEEVLIGVKEIEMELDMSVLADESLLDDINYGNANQRRRRFQAFKSRLGDANDRLIPSSLEYNVNGGLSSCAALFSIISFYKWYKSLRS